MRIFMAVLDELFNGEINPKERINPVDPEYTRINEEVDAIMLQLQECLDQDQYEIVGDLCQLLDDSHSIYDSELFRYAFALGMSMAQDDLQ